MIVRIIQKKFQRKKKQQYPDKLKIFAYNHNVLSFDLTYEEYKYVQTLPDDSPRLYCNQCNFGLSKAKYKYVVKIDADQIYFKDEIEKWRKVCANPDTVKWDISFVFGCFFMLYFSFYRRLSARLNKPELFLLPDILVSLFADSYVNYAKWKLAKGKVSIALSGVNLFKDDRWYIPFDKFNIHPPYNGEGDTVIFKLSDQTFFSRRYGNKITYCCTELFHQPYKVMYAGPVWFHLHANRAYCFEKVKKVKEQHPELFISPEKFVEMTYNQVHKAMDHKVHTLYQRTLFALVHKMGLRTVKSHLWMLDKIKV